MTDAEYLNWLNDPTSVYTFLIEAQALVGGSETTFYMSTDGYQSRTTDGVLANINYAAIASLGTMFTEQLSLDGGDASISQGSFEIANATGEYDIWRTYVWANRPIKVFIGDARWPRTDFRQIFSGVSADLKPSGRDKLVLQIRDKMQLLNTSVTETKLGGTTQNKDSIIPIPLGEVHNVTPLQEDPALLTFRVAQNAIEAIKEVRDAGIPLTGTSAPIIDNAVGRIRLVANPSGAITCSVQGDKDSGTYINTCAALIKHLVTVYGNDSTRLFASDIDLTNFSNFDISNPVPMGRWISDRDNVLTVCKDLASSLGAQITFSVTTGQLRILQIGSPVGPTVYVTAADMEPLSLGPENSPDVVAAVKLAFNKNWTPQDAGTLNGIPYEHKDLYGEEWLTTTQVDATVKANYKKTADPEQVETMLLRRIEADAEALRRLNYWKVPRTVYYFTGLPWLFTAELGQPINVKYNRFGMDNSVTGMITSIARDWKNHRVKIGFIV